MNGKENHSFVFEFSPLVPGFFYIISDTSLPLFYNSGPQDIDIQNLTLKTVIKKPENYRGNLRLWNWISLGLCSASIISIILTPLIEGGAGGVLSMTSHGLWAISNIFLAISYYDLQKSLKAYGKSGFFSGIGMASAISVVIGAIITLNIGASLFGGYNEDIMILTISLAAVTDTLGLGTIIYTFFYDAFLYPGS